MICEVDFAFFEAWRRYAGWGAHGLLGGPGREGGCPLSHVFFQHPSAIIGKSRLYWLPHASQIKNDCTIESFCNIHIERAVMARTLSVKMRLDHLLVARGLASTRSKAQDLIRRGAVRIAGRTVLKTGLEVCENRCLEVLETERYVARSAWKLRAALDAFGFSPKGRVCLDIGA